MGEKALVEGLVEDAAKLIRSLDATEYKPTLAAWYYYDDAAEWRLLIAGPKFDEFLPKQEALAYQKISESISAENMDNLSISLVKLVATKAPLPSTLKLLIGTGADGITQAHFTDTTVNGIFIKEMMILRSA